MSLPPPGCRVWRFIARIVYAIDSHTRRTRNRTHARRAHTFKQTRTAHTHTVDQVVYGVRVAGGGGALAPAGGPRGATI